MSSSDPQGACYAGGGGDSLCSRMPDYNTGAAGNNALGNSTPTPAVTPAAAPAPLAAPAPVSAPAAPDANYCVDAGICAPPDAIPSMPAMPDAMPDSGPAPDAAPDPNAPPPDAGPIAPDPKAAPPQDPNAPPPPAQGPCQNGATVDSGCGPNGLPLPPAIQPANIPMPDNPSPDTQAIIDGAERCADWPAGTGGPTARTPCLINACSLAYRRNRYHYKVPCRSIIRSIKCPTSRSRVGRLARMPARLTHSRSRDSGRPRVINSTTCSPSTTTRLPRRSRSRRSSHKTRQCSSRGSRRSTPADQRSTREGVKNPTESDGRATRPSLSAATLPPEFLHPGPFPDHSFEPAVSSPLNHLRRR